MKTLMQKSLTQFVACVAVLLLLATPLFYWLTKNFYAEDIYDIIEAVGQGRRLPAIDIEQDILAGIAIQFAIIAFVLGVAIVVAMVVLQKRLWRPFESTLQKMEQFRLEEGRVTALQPTDVKEFARLNAAITQLMETNLRSYRLQKEFTENASHELQTPLAVLQGRLDMLLQQPDLSESQAAIVSDLYHTIARMASLNRSLLLLAKMENNQFSRTEPTDMVAVVSGMMPQLETIAGQLKLVSDLKVATLSMPANRALAESMVSNLVVNAVRHNKEGGEISLTLDSGSLAVANTSDEPPLDTSKIFSRFYRPSEKTPGNGLGLAIVKAVCDYHGWSVGYEYRDPCHVFTVTFHK